MFPFAVVILFMMPPIEFMVDDAAVPATFSTLDAMPPARFIVPEMVLDAAFSAEVNSPVYLTWSVA